MQLHDKNHKYSGIFPFLTKFSTDLKSMSLQSHSQIEFMYFFDGGCKYVLDENEINVRKNDLIVVNSGQTHECEDFENSAAFLIIADKKLLASYGGIEFENHIEKDEHIVKIFEKLRRSFGRQNYEFACASCVYELLSILIEKYSNVNDFLRLKGSKGEKYEAVKKALVYVQNNITEDLSAKTLAEQAHLSVSRFEHLFKEITSETPASYVEKSRISHAMNLLAATDVKIAEVAYLSGFSDHSYFSKRFRARFNMSPEEYRRKNRPF